MEIDTALREAMAEQIVEGQRRGEKDMAVFVRRELEKRPEFARRLPKNRTWQRWIRKMLLNVPQLKDVDAPFNWHKLDSIGVPWDASAYVLEMWAWVLEDGPFNGTTTTHRPSMREVKWWWRVHLADPDMNMFGVWRMAQGFTAREIASDYLNGPVYFDDLQATLAYKPSQSAEKWKIYLDAVEAGRIPASGYVSPEGETQLLEELLPDAQDYFEIVGEAWR